MTISHFTVAGLLLLAFGAGSAMAQDRKSDPGHKASEGRLEANVPPPLPAKRPSGHAVGPPLPKNEPLFMSDEYMKREKLTEDRLRRSMTICKGC